MVDVSTSQAATTRAQRATSLDTVTDALIEHQALLGLLNASLGPATYQITKNLVLAATLESTDSILLLETSANALLCVEVFATTSGVCNYTLAFFDGDPDDNLLLYQASGITAMTFRDLAPFFVNIPASGSIVAKATNVDSDATSITFTIRYFLA